MASSLDHPKVVVVMPAFNAAKTLKMTYDDLPRDKVDLVIVVDDGSSDETAKIAREMGLELYVHDRNYGYGANQKTCYREALKAGGDIIVMVHPDYQYDPTLLPEIVRPIEEGKADVVLGSRLMGINPIEEGMPWWKYIANRFLTKIENWAFGMNLSEYHTGYRAYSSKVLERVNFERIPISSSSTRKSLRKWSSSSSGLLRWRFPLDTFLKRLRHHFGKAVCTGYRSCEFFVSLFFIAPVFTLSVALTA